MRGIANGHRRRSAAEWRGIIERYRQSGLGINEFCAQEGVTVGTFELWYRRHRRTEHRTGQFVEVKPLGVVGLWAVEVELPGGVRLRLRG
jgi:hypothetical protein